MQIKVQSVQNLLFIFIICEYGVLKKPKFKDIDLKMQLCISLE